MDKQKEIQSAEFKIHRLHSKIMFEKNGLRLHPQQVPTLLCVLKNEGYTQRLVACRQNISPAAVGVSVRRLEKSGFLRVEADENDLRARKLFVTESGKEALEESRRAADEVVSAKLWGFSESELESYLVFLNRMYDNLKQYSEKGNKE